MILVVLIECLYLIINLFFRHVFYLLILRQRSGTKEADAARLSFGGFERFLKDSMMSQADKRVEQARILLIHDYLGELGSCFFTTIQVDFEVGVN